MAAKAKAEITLSRIVDIESATRYYKLQESTMSAPAVPTTNPPEGWSTTEPTYTSGSTNTLYFVDLIVFTNGKFKYSAVSKSSSYEAAKAAYNKALEAAKVATNYMKLKNEGLIVGNMTGSTLGQNVLIDTDSVDIRMGDTVLASYGEDYVYLGKNKKESIIDLCAGTVTMSNKKNSSGNTYFNISSKNYIGIEAVESFRVDLTHGTGYALLYLDVPTLNIEVSKNGRTNAFFLLEEEQFTLHCNKNDIFADGNSGLVLQTDIDLNLCGKNTTIDSNFLYITGITVMDNRRALRSIGTDGVERDLIQMSEADNTVIGYGGWKDGVGRTNLYGNHIHFYAKDANNANFRPYYAGGESFSTIINTAGYITNSGKRVVFTIPLTKFVLGNPKVTVSSVNGLIIRQNNKYLYGSSATAYAKPVSYTATIRAGQCIYVHADMPNTTNVVNNSACGVIAEVKVAFIYA